MVDFCRNDAERRTEESNISRSNPARALARLHSDSSFTHHGQLIYVNSNADYVTSRRFLSRTMTILPPTFIPTICLYVCNKHFNNSLFCSHLRNAMQKRNNFAIKEDNPKRVIIKKYKKKIMRIFRKSPKKTDPHQRNTDRNTILLCLLEPASQLRDVSIHWERFVRLKFQ